MNQAPPSHIKALCPEFQTPPFKQALSGFATGFTVITTFAPVARKGDSTSSTFVDVTASSFNSVSLTPPLVLWSLGQGASSAPLFHSGTHYVVNVLAADQHDLCNRFAFGKGDRFVDTAYKLCESDLPILDVALAWIECHNRSRHEEGDHVIFVDEVERCDFGHETGPLVYQCWQFSSTEHLLHNPLA